MSDVSVDDYASEFNYKIINDPIYGCIGLSRTEVELLDTRAMQRLRRIRQMGFASYVFPSGEHSRFVHSLGVLCIIGKLCDQLFRKYGKKSQSIDGVFFSLEDVRLVRVAALLHDVGHFPFSHLNEQVYSYIDNVENTKKMIENSETRNSETCLISVIANFKKRKEKDHEHLGALVINNDHEIKDILTKSNISPTDVGEIIVGDSHAKPVHAQLLHSSLDADRLDYLLRDSRQAGVSFGNVELDYIIRQVRIKKCPIQRGGGEVENIELVVFDFRARHAIEHFLMGRYFHYTQVVLHKTSMAFEAVAKALIYRVLRSDPQTPYPTYEKIVQLIGSDLFYKFTDDYFWQLISDTAEHSEDGLIKTLWNCINCRNKPKHVITMNDIIPKLPANPKAKPVNDSAYFLAKWLIENSQEEIARELEINPEYIGFVESKVSLESIPSYLRAEECALNGFEDAERGAIRILNADDTVSFLASDGKSLINKMVDYTSNNLDIFVVGDLSEDKVEKLRLLINMKARQ